MVYSSGHMMWATRAWWLLHYAGLDNVAVLNGGFAAWQAAGSKTMGDRVRERVAEILATHEVPPLPAAVDAGIDEILAAADGQAGAAQTDLV